MAAAKILAVKAGTLTPPAYLVLVDCSLTQPQLPCFVNQPATSA